MIGQWAATVTKGTAAARNGKAEATTTRLIALLRITACSATNRNAPIRSGYRNSAPPKPISPPSAPIIGPPPKAAGLLRRFVPDTAIAQHSRYDVLTIAKLLNLRPGVRASAPRERCQIIDGIGRLLVPVSTPCFSSIRGSVRCETATPSGIKCAPRWCSRQVDFHHMLAAISLCHWRAR
jgi:hypothetical protein